MKSTLVLTVLFAVALMGLDARAYEQATHALLTSNGFTSSILAAPDADSIASAIRNLGLDGANPLGDGERYFEFIANLSGLSAYERIARPYEKDILGLLRVDLQANSFKTWLMYGAIREDDNPSEDPPTPQDVAPGLKRPLSHFFDPYLDRPLTFTGLNLIDSDVHKNPDWALGSRDSFNDPNLAEIPRRNYFSVFDARESMFRALTLMTDNGTDYVDIASGKDAAIRQQWRQAYWATTFRALGDVLHLNQDMAQPQHTRNEPHSGKVCPSKYPPAEPGALICEPLKAAVGVANAAPIAFGHLVGGRSSPQV